MPLEISFKILQIGIYKYLIDIYLILLELFENEAFIWWRYSDSGLTPEVLTLFEAHCRCLTKIGALTKLGI